ncbi:hypothetical protein GCM10011487_69310 [Steroidobacter agaridevorans]|uniref:Uncharacterized protein n=1 Tax=Steroidobacter agaridevorans TaxID=2695856 RepID=A0A829YPK1_9GAMM|nr:hypothetical protein GCM10011487_69310 [Steroidobacter agaridevorans]
MAGAEDSGAGRLHAAEVSARSAMAAAQKVKDCFLLDKRTSLSLGVQLCVRGYTEGENPCKEAAIATSDIHSARVFKEMFNHDMPKVPQERAGTLLYDWRVPRVHHA